MDGMKTIFQEEAKSSELNPEEQCSVITIYTSAANLISRQKIGQSPFPTIEFLLESMIYGTELENKLKDKPLVLAQEIISELSGYISYHQFVTGMINNRNLIRSLYEPTYNKRSTERLDNLKKMAEKHAQIVVKDQIKRTKSKKKTK